MQRKEKSVCLSMGAPIFVSPLLHALGLLVSFLQTTTKASENHHHHHQ
jgi:flagellar biosynthesis protein FliQ